MNNDALNKELKDSLDFTTGVFSSQKKSSILGLIKTENIDIDTTPIQHSNNIDTTSTMTSIQHRYNIDTKPIQHRYNIDTGCDTSSATTPIQHRYNIDTKQASFHDIGGNEKTILMMFNDICKRANNNQTGQIYLDKLSESLECKKESARMALNRLVTKGCIKRIKSYKGRPGWTIYEMNHKTRNEILDFERNHESQHRYNIDTTPIQHSSNIDTVCATGCDTRSPYNNKTLNKDIIIILNTDELNALGVHFGKSQAAQLTALGISELSAQASIDAFVHDLNNWSMASDGKFNKRANIAYLMGAFRNSGEYTAVTPGFESIEEMAIREQAEAILKKQERTKRDKAVISEDAFENWYEKIDNESLIKAVPGFNGVRNGGIKRFAKAYFMEDVYDG